MKTILLAITLLFGMTCHAGFQGINNLGANVGVYNKIECGSGVTCTKHGNKFKMAAASTFLQSMVAATATTITGAQCGSTFYNTGAVTINLPAGSASLVGCRLTFVTLNAAAYVVNPDDAAQILVLTNAVGDSISNATLGNSITLQMMSATQWVQVSAIGTYTDAN